MTAKEYLGQIRVLETKIRQKDEQIEYLRSAASGVGAIQYDKDRVQTSNVDSSIERYILKYIELEEEVRQQRMQLEELRNVIIGQIQAMNDDRFVNVLFKRYVEIKSFNVIAEEMNYSYDHIRHIHRKALDGFNLTHVNTQ